MVAAMNPRRRRVLQTDGVALAQELYGWPFEPWDLETVRTLVMCAVAAVGSRPEIAASAGRPSNVAAMKVVCALHQAVGNHTILTLTGETSLPDVEHDLRKLAALEIFKQAKGLDSEVGETVRRIFGVR